MDLSIAIAIRISENGSQMSPDELEEALKLEAVNHANLTLQLAPFTGATVSDEREEILKGRAQDLLLVIVSKSLEIDWTGNTATEVVLNVEGRTYIATTPDGTEV